jgi:acyl carrier protein
MSEQLIQIINMIRTRKNKEPIESLNSEISLRMDLGFDSFDLAELTVRIQDAYNVDIFENRIVDKISDFLPLLINSN